MCSPLLSKWVNNIVADRPEEVAKPKDVLK